MSSHLRHGPSLSLNLHQSVMHFFSLSSVFEFFFAPPCSSSFRLFLFLTSIERVVETFWFCLYLVCFVWPDILLIYLCPSVMQIWRCPTWFETRKRRSRLLFSFTNVIAKFSSLKFEYGFFFWEFSLFFAFGMERKNTST